MLGFTKGEHSSEGLNHFLNAISSWTPAPGNPACPFLSPETEPFRVASGSWHQECLGEAGAALPNPTMKNNGFLQQFFPWFSSERAFSQAMFSDQFLYFDSQPRIQFLYTSSYQLCALWISSTVRKRHQKKEIPVSHYKPLKTALNIAINNLFANLVQSWSSLHDLEWFQSQAHLCWHMGTHQDGKKN